MTIAYTYNDDNLLTKVNSSNGTSSGIPTDAQEISYTSFGRPNCISEKGNSLIYTYNSNYEKAKIESTVDNNTVTKLSYANGKYRRIRRGNKTIQRLYLGGDAYTAFAVLERKDKNNRIYYLHRDYLGSITGITDSEGNLQAEYSYTAWGRLRNPKSWEVYAVGNEPMPMFGRGYTGHEHLSAFGLINMNARLYDAGLGRFLSPDPFVQSPDFSQNFNRYSYALNNPLKYTNPDGEWLEWVLLAVGAYLGGAKANENEQGKWQFDPIKWEPNFKTFGYMLGGAAIGYMGGAAIGGLFAGTTTLNVGLTYQKLASVFAEINLSGAGATLEGLGYIAAAGGGAYVTGSAINNWLKGKDNRASSSGDVYSGDNIFLKTYTHYQFGSRKNLHINASSLEFHGITMDHPNFKGLQVGDVRSINLYQPDHLYQTQTALALGKVEVKYQGNNKFSILPDYYDFNIEWHQGLSKRNIATLGAGLLHGPVIDNYYLSPYPISKWFGGPYQIIFHENVTIPYY